MNRDELIAELKKHADGIDTDLDQHYLANVIQFEEKLESVQSIVRSGDSIIQLLDRLQDHRGKNPTEDHWDRSIPILLVYSMSGIMHLLADSLIQSKQGSIDPNAVMQTLWRVSCAWDAFLAGDIENIVEHVRLEYSLSNDHAERIIHRQS